MYIGIPKIHGIFGRDLPRGPLIFSNNYIYDLCLNTYVRNNDLMIYMYFRSRSTTWAPQFRSRSTTWAPQLGCPGFGLDSFYSTRYS